MNISEKVCAVIERETSTKPVTESTSIDALKCDSLDFIDLLLAIERETGIVVPDSKVPELHTVADIIGMAA